MQKYIKAGILTLVLVLPALIVLFLHGFAENHFQLPYLVPLTDSTGNVSMNGKDTVFYQVPDTAGDKIRVISFTSKYVSSQIQEAFSRVTKLASEKVLVENIAMDEVEATQKYRVAPLKKERSSQTIPYNEQFILIDKKGFIRGFYDGTNPEDVERLFAETKILLDIHQKEEN